MTHNIKLNYDKNIILIDCSYYVFYRYFATLRWFSFQKIDFTIDDIISDELFLSTFYKHFESDLKKLCKKWKTDIKNIIFCMDCFRCDIWRNDIYKDYKAGRQQNQKFDKRIFQCFYDYIFKMNIETLSSDRLEGDDIIYLVQKNLKSNVNNNIIIISNDSDFLQLVKDNVCVFNMQLKELKSKSLGNYNTDLLVKAIYGDKSDNINKIGMGITKEKAYNIACLEEKERNEFLKTNNLYEKFKFNMTLISFENIPVEYVEKFNKKIKFIK